MLMFHEVHFVSLHLPRFSTACSHIFFPVVENAEQFAVRQRRCSQLLKSSLIYLLCDVTSKILTTTAARALIGK